METTLTPKQQIDTEQSNYESQQYTKIPNKPKIQQKNMNSKIRDSVEEVLENISNGSIIMLGGFGMCGVPENLIRGLMNKGLSDLHIIAGTGGSDEYGPGLLVKNKMVQKLDTTFIGSKEINEQYMNGELELNVIPQGDFTEKIRAGRAGIPAFYTSTVLDTQLEYGLAPLKYQVGGTRIQKYSEIPEYKEFHGKKYLMQKAYKSDFCLIKAWKADSYGNLVYRQTARNFNPLMAGSGRVTIVEVEEIVEDGILQPEEIHTPGIYVNYIVKGAYYTKPIGVLAIKEEGINNDIRLQHNRLSKRIKIAKRAAQEIKGGMYVNLGIGIPTLVSNYVQQCTGVLLQGENGVLGMGPFPSTEQQVDPDIMNPSRQSITLVTGASIFSSDTSFDMIRGGHIQITMLGALQVSQYGDIANWVIPGKRIFGMGGAMELAKNCHKCIICMEHVSENNLKILDSCTFPLTAKRAAHLIITDCAVFDVHPENGLTLIEISQDNTLDYVTQHTASQFTVSPSLKYIETQMPYYFS